MLFRSNIMESGEFVIKPAVDPPEDSSVVHSSSPSGTVIVDDSEPLVDCSSFHARLKPTYDLQRLGPFSSILNLSIFEGPMLLKVSLGTDRILALKRSCWRKCRHDNREPTKLGRSETA